MSEAENKPVDTGANANAGAEAVQGNPAPKPAVPDAKEADAKVAADKAAADRAGADKADKDKADKAVDKEAEAAAAKADADKEAADKENAPLDSTVWGKTGDEVADSVLVMLQNSGMSVDDAKALIYEPLTKHNDPSKINRDALVEKIGAAKANLVMAGIENYTEREAKRTTGIMDTVHASAGGKEGWDKVAAWASATIPDADRAELNDLLNLGGNKAKYAASEYVRMYNADAKNTSLGATGLIEGDSTKSTQGEAIDKKTYAERLEKAHRMKATPAAIAEIQRARERGRTKGI